MSTRSTSAPVDAPQTLTDGFQLTVSAPGFLNGLVALADATTNCSPMI
jgi:oxalyl-CoA decarboxylase